MLNTPGPDSSDMDLDMLAPTLERKQQDSWEDWFKEFNPSDLIKLLRERRGWSQIHLGHLIGVDSSVISNWENKKKPVVRVDVIYKLAWAFNVPVGLFFGPAWGEGTADPELVSMIEQLTPDDRNTILTLATSLSRK